VPKKPASREAYVLLQNAGWGSRKKETAHILGSLIWNFQEKRWGENGIIRIL
jgi:hypothetical protein